MISLRNFNGRTELLHVDSVARVTEAGPSSKWHGIYAVVKLFDGSSIESANTVEEILRLIEAEKATKSQS